MKKYKIAKIGENTDNKLASMSKFGYTQKYFEGYSKVPPVIDERFVLIDSLGFIVIDTSPVVKVEENSFKTLYSVYSIQEIK